MVRVITWITKACSHNKRFTRSRTLAKRSKVKSLLCIINNGVIQDLELETNHWIGSIGKLIHSKALALFLGAGISKNPPSNLPLAGELRACILENLVTDQEMDVEVLAKMKGEPDEMGKVAYPFEYFIQTIDRGSGKRSKFLKHMITIYKAGYPNMCHVLVARLVKSGHVQEIMTTNFDTKLEQAMENESMTNGKDFKVFFSEKHFSEVDLERLEVPVVFKIHGSVVDEESLRATLDLISRQGLMERRARVLKHFFTNNPNLMVMGYSASDEFDINPVILSTRSKSKLFWIRRPENSEAIRELRYPFKHFNGKVIECDLNVVAERLWKMFVNVEWRENLEIDTKWRPEIERWVNSLHPGQRYFLIARICHDIKELDAAEKHYKEGLRIVEGAGNSAGMALFLHNLAVIEQFRGNHDKARDLLRRSLEIFKRVGSETEVSSTVNQLGIAQKNLGKYKEAERLFKASLNGFQRQGYRIGIAQTLHNLATIQRIRGNYNQAKLLYERSLRISEDIGDPSGIAKTSHDMGEILVLQGNYDSAESLYKRQKEIASKLGDPSGMAKAIHSLGIINQLKGNYDEAKRLYTHSLEIFERLGNQDDIAVAFHDLGMIERLQLNYDKAEMMLRRSLEIEQKLGDRRGMAQTLHEIGVVKQRQGNYGEANKLLRHSLEIKKELGSPHLVAITLAQLGLLEEDLGNKQEAISYLVQALAIFRRLDEKVYMKQVEEALRRVQSGQ